MLDAKKSTHLKGHKLLLISAMILGTLVFLRNHLLQLSLYLIVGPQLKLQHLQLLPTQLQAGKVAWEHPDFSLQLNSALLTWGLLPPQLTELVTQQAVLTLDDVSTAESNEATSLNAVEQSPTQLCLAIPINSFRAHKLRLQPWDIELNDLFFKRREDSCELKSGLVLLTKKVHAKTAATELTIKDNHLTAKVASFKWAPLEQLLHPIDAKIAFNKYKNQVQISGQATSQFLAVDIDGLLELSQMDYLISLRTPQIELTSKLPLSKFFKDWKIPLEAHQGAIASKVEFSSGADPLTITTTINNAGGMIISYPFSGLRAQVKFNQLGQLESIRPISIESLDLGIPISNLQFALALSNLPRQPVYQLKSLSGQILGGEIIIASATIKPEHPEPQALRVQLKDLDLSEILKMTGPQAASASGRISIDLPIKLIKLSPSVDHGSLWSKQSGYIKLPPAAAQQSNIAWQALENLHYESLSGSINYETNGDLLISLNILGSNPNLLQGQTFKLNLKIEQNLVKLLASIRASQNEVSNIISATR